MLLYYPFWMFMGFILHIYIIFGTNLLTGGPAHIVLLAYFSVSKKRNIKRSPNGMKPSGAWFLERTWSRGLGVQAKKQSRQLGDRRARPPLQGAPLSPGPLERPPTYFFLLYIPTYPQTTRYGAKNLIPPPQPSVPVRSHLGAFAGAPPEGESTTEGFYINTIAPPMSCE